MTIRPDVHPYFHSATGSWSYLVVDPGTGETAVIDPVLDYDPASGRTATLFADALLAHLHDRALVPRWILETHAHADHLSAAAYLRQATGAPVAIGAGIVAVQRHFKGVFGLDDSFGAEGRPFDRLLADGERLPLGTLGIEVVATPGHTNDSVSYRIGDAVFVGDTVFAPDVGTARCDFPGGDAATLWRSIQRLLALPEDTRVFLCHDYPPGGREPVARTTLAELRARNPHLAGRSEAEYVALREARDRELPVPRLLYPAVQVNIRAGELPAPDAAGRRYLRIPVTEG